MRPTRAMVTLGKDTKKKTAPNKRGGLLRIAIGLCFRRFWRFLKQCFRRQFDGRCFYFTG